MDWLTHSQIAALAGSALLALVMYVLYSRYHHRYLKLWAAAWSIYTLRFVVELAGGFAGQDLAATIIARSLTLVSSIALLSGAYAYLSRSLPRVWIVACGIGLVWLLVLAMISTDLRVLTGAPSIVISAAYACTGCLILRSRAPQSVGATMAGWSFVLWSLLQLSYPVRMATEPWREWGFLAKAILEMAAAVGFLLMFFEATNSELERSAERLHRVERDLRARVHQQETVALLGQVALSGGDSSILLKGAAQAIGRELGVDFCEILELLPEGDRLIFRAGLPNVEHLIDRETVAAGQGSQAGFTLLSREPVIMADIDAETRFSPNHLMREHGIVSGMSAVIGGRERPFGVLNVSTTQRRAFTKDDTLFLQSLANVLAAAIERKLAEEALRRQERAARKLAQEESVMSEIGRIVGSTLNVEEVYDQFAAAVNQILPFDRIAINLVDAERQTVTCQYVSGLSAEGRQSGDRFDLAGTATAACVASCRGMLLPALPIEEIEARLPGHTPVRRVGLQTALLAPLVSKGNVFGALAIMSTDANQYTEHNIPLAENVAAQISGAIAHARLLNELIQAQAALKDSESAARRLAGEKAVMAEIGRIVGSTLAMGDVYERFSEEVRKIVAFDRITITRIHPERATAQILYSNGPKVPGRGLGEEYPLAGTMSAAVVEKKKGMVFSPPSAKELTAAFPTILPMWAAGFRSFLLVPLIGRDQVIGTLVMSSYATDGYGPEDVALAESIASQISGAVANAQLFAEHTQMANALRESEASLNSIFRVAPIGIGVVGATRGSEASLDRVLRAAPDGMGAGYERILGRVNDRMCEMLGYAAEELTGKSARLLYLTDEDFDYVGREKYIQIREKGTGAVETRWRRKDGTTIDVLLTSTPIDPSDLSRGVIFTALDITESKRAEQERRSLEERLRQAQKMEAIGTLAGGIAHDFNNILAAIIGFGELARIEASASSEATASINGILKASFRARDLVRQILSFSRQTEAELLPIQAHLVVKEAVKLLRASLPATIRLRQNMTSQAYIMGDPTQIQQVVMNLCTNAYHAMREEGGVLDVNLTEVRVDPSRQMELQDVKPGRYLKLSVRDTGPGIDPAVIHRIFDPYFTTKEKTKGTGLGLAVVHGVVKSHKGTIQVSSRLGAGTTFDVFFPVIDQALGNASPGKAPAAAGGRERILFVDDEPAIEELAERLLGGLGYAVVTCPNARDALDLFRADPACFDLVITDMTMPGMTGDRMAMEMLCIRPELPVILCTGYNELINMDRAKEIGLRALLMKPFLQTEAAAVIREVLDQNHPLRGRPST
jgi:PAS domain S-box-containing protein